MNPLFLLPVVAVAYATPTPFHHGASVSLSYDLIGGAHPAVQMGVEVPVLNSGTVRGKVPGPPKWQLYAAPGLSARYKRNDAIGYSLGGGLGVHHVGRFGWKQELQLGTSWLRMRDLDPALTDPKVTDHVAPRAALRWGRDDWLPYHSRISWEIGPAVELQRANGEGWAALYGVEIGLRWRTRRP